MDPDATLRELRDTFSRLEQAEAQDDLRGTAELLVDRAAELFDALDTWLSQKKSFKPADWA